MTAIRADDPRTLPFAVRVVNTLGTRMRLERRLDLDPDALATHARKRTGLDDLGTDEFAEPLRVLTSALHEEARLTPVGRWLARENLRTLLANRLLMQRDWSADPAIEAGTIRAPVVIAGLPRSGTTILQHLLGQDPANRTLRHWEASRPSPPPDPAVTDDPRIGQVARAIRLVYRLAPEAEALHPQRAELPTECVSLFAHSVASWELAAIHRVPSYVEWLLAADLTPHYAYYRRQLQLLQRHMAAERWVLKSPGHLFHLDALIDTFPDVRIVQIHRDPAAVMPSYASLVCVLRRLGSGDVDPSDVGRRWCDVWAEGVRRAARVRAGDEDRFVDLTYDALVRDPVGVVRGLYDRLGYDLTPATERRMRSFLDTHRQHRHGVHRYRPEDFGLTADELRGRFAPITPARRGTA